TASSGLTEEEISKAAKSNEDWMLGQKEDPEFQDRKTRAEELFREFEQLWPKLNQAAANGLGQEPLTRAQAAWSVARLQLAQKESEALGRIHANMGGPRNGRPQPPAQAPHPWLPSTPAATPPAEPAAAGETQMFASPPIPSAGQTQTFASPPLPQKAEPPPPTSPW